MAIAGSLTYDTSIDKKGFEKGLNDLKGVASTAFKQIEIGMAAIATGMTALGTYSMKVGSSFEAGMSKVQAISGATSEELGALTEKAKEMGAKTKFSASESAAAFQYMAMAGWKTEDMLNGIEGIMNLAAASGEDLAGVSDIVTDALTAFGLRAKDSGHFADVLAKASSNSNTNVGLMGETFKYVAPLAGSMGYSIEDTAVAIGLMANAGIKGSQAGTSLRSTMTRLVKPPKEAADALKKLGVSATNSDGTMKPLSETMGELREKFSKLNESQKTSYASSIAGQEAMSGLLAIVNASDEDYEKLVDSISRADGASQEMADTMNNNLAGATTIMQSNMESLGIAIYDKFKEPAMKGVKDVTKVIEDLTKNVKDGKLSKSFEKLGDSFGKLITKGGELVAKVLPKLIDGLCWVIDHGSMIVKAIGAITAAIVFFKTTAILSGPILSWQKAIKVLTSLEGGTKGMTIAQAALNGSLTLGQTMVALLTGKISLATVAQKLWNTAIAANPVAVFVGALAGLVAVVKVVYDKMNESEKRVKGAFERMGASASDFIKGIDNANSHLDDFNSTLFVSAEEQQKLQDEMQEVQTGITNICKTAADERRGYTQEEITQLNEYFQKLRELNQREIEIQQSISDAITQQAVTNAQTFQGSLEEYKIQSQEWLKTALDQRDKTLELIEKQSIEEIAALNQRYGEQANVQNEAYATEYNNIMEQKQTKIDAANAEVAEISQVYENGYLERAKQNAGFYTVLSEYNSKVEEENNRHNDEIEKRNNAKDLTESSRKVAIIDENNRHSYNLKGIWKEMYKNMSDEQEKELGIWLANVAQTELYGGKIDDETQKTVDAILESYDSMPKGTKEAMRNAMEPMLTEMQNKEPSLFAKASGIADGILSRLKKSFDIHSPSRKMKKIFRNVMQGAEIGIDDEKDDLMKQVDDISEQVIRKMRNVVALETSSINASATLRLNKEQPIVIEREHTVNIDNTQNFYDKTSSPHEIAKATKNTLRRFAYGV